MALLDDGEQFSMVFFAHFVLVGAGGGTSLVQVRRIQITSCSALPHGRRQPLAIRRVSKLDLQFGKYAGIARPLVATAAAGGFTGQGLAERRRRQME